MLSTVYIVMVSDKEVGMYLHKTLLVAEHMENMLHCIVSRAYRATAFGAERVYNVQVYKYKHVNLQEQVSFSLQSQAVP